MLKFFRRLRSESLKIVVVLGCIGALIGLTISFSLAQSASAQTTAPASQSQPDKDQQNKPDQGKDQNIPDAPSAVQPPPVAPENPLPAAGSRPPNADPSPLGNQAPPRDIPPPATTAPPLNIRTVPQGGATKDQDAAQEEFFKIIVKVNQVMIPVTVKDESGHLVNGLVSQDFTVLENDKKQKLNFFTSDPFALSAAVILDLGMKDVDVQKVDHTFPALEGAFSEFDEVSIYAYSNTVSQISNWGAAGEKLADTLDNLREVRGRNNGPPVSSGPLGPQGPTINNLPVDPAAPTVYAPQQESHVMNDAILKAALDLSRRDHTRRKIIFVVTDGREYRSNASYRDVLRVLLTNNIVVYGIDVGGTGVPGYNKLQKLHIPRFGYSDIIPKYTSATGGEVFNELTRSSIEDAYLQAMGDARNQYTLGYTTEAEVSGSYRPIEVRVNKPSCHSSIRPCVNVYARDGYYPAPPAR